MHGFSRMIVRHKVIVKFLILGDDFLKHGLKKKSLRLKGVKHDKKIK